MKSLLLILSLFVCFVCSGPAEAWEFKPFDGWDKTEVTMLAANYSLGAVDMLQTQWIFKHEDDGWYEKNPAINWGVDKMGTGFIPLWFLASAVVEYAVADALPHGYRKTFLAVTTIWEGYVVYHNNSIGLGLSFEF